MITHPPHFAFKKILFDEPDTLSPWLILSFSHSTIACHVAVAPGAWASAYLPLASR